MPSTSNIRVNITTIDHANAYAIELIAVPVGYVIESVKNFSSGISDRSGIKTAYVPKHHARVTRNIAFEISEFYTPSSSSFGNEIPSPLDSAPTGSVFDIYLFASDSLGNCLDTKLGSINLVGNTAFAFDFVMPDSFSITYDPLVWSFSA